jgi:hypothetical protein
MTFGNGCTMKDISRWRPNRYSPHTSDHTRQIIVDAGPRWWKEVNLQPGEQVSVRGEMGKGGELDAFEITRGDGSVIDIRPDNGPPPWAGGAKGKSAQPKPKP